MSVCKNVSRRNGGCEPIYLARDLSYLDASYTKLVDFVSASHVMRTLPDGAVDAAALTLNEPILIQQQGLYVRIVLEMDYSNGDYHRIFTK